MNNNNTTSYNESTRSIAAQEAIKLIDKFIDFDEVLFQNDNDKSDKIKVKYIKFCSSSPLSLLQLYFAVMSCITNLCVLFYVF